MSNSNVQNDDNQVIPKEENLENQSPKVLLGDYEVKGELGEGSFGKVLQVVHKDNTEVKYAMKYFNKNLVMRKNQIEGLKKEFHIMKELDSKFVANVIEVFHTPQNLCFVMEYCQVGDFCDLMRNIGPMKKRHARFYSAELFCAIKYLHEMNVVHQDIKPENLLLTQTGHLKICDFGLSESNMLPQSKLTRCCGSRYYLSPEKVLRIEYTRNTDWWTFGLLIADFFGCHLPFERATTQGTESAIVNLIMEWDREMPEHALDLVKGLLKYEDERLNQDGISNHRFFRSVIWEDYEQQRVRPPKTYIRAEDNGLSEPMESEDFIEIDERNDVFNMFTYKRLPMN